MAPPSPASDPLRELCAEIAAAVKRTWGRGPVRITAHRAGPSMLVVLLHGGHTDREQALRAAGHVAAVLEGRKVVHQLVEHELQASVEKATGRAVITMLSTTRLDPDLSAVICLLGSALAAQQGL